VVFDKFDSWLWFELEDSEAFDLVLFDLGMAKFSSAAFKMSRLSIWEDTQEDFGRFDSWLWFETEDSEEFDLVLFDLGMTRFSGAAIKIS